MIAEYRALWNVPGGGSGFSVFHFTFAGSAPVAQTIAANTRTFFNSLAASFPDDVQINFDTEVLDKNDDGSLVAAWAVTPPAEVQGTNAGIYARAVGARVDWGTGTIVAGRRLVGRTYLVPMAASLFDSTGVITAASITTILNAANALITATGLNRPLRVWSRTHQTSSVVTNAAVPPSGAVLRGRRD